MPKREYAGPFPEVDLVLPDGTTTTVKRGDTVEIEDTEVVANLDSQGDWRTPAATAPLATPTAPKTTTEEQP